MTPLLTLDAEQGGRQRIIDLIVENSSILKVIEVLDQHPLDQFHVGDHSSAGEKEEKSSEWVIGVLVLEVIVPKDLGNVPLIWPVLDVSEKRVYLVVRYAPSLPVSMTSSGREDEQ